MRLPSFDSLAGRLGALLVSGQLLTIAATLSVFLSDSLRGSDWNQTETAMERIVLAASVAQRLPADARQGVVQSIGATGIRFAWEADASPPSLARDFTTKHLTRDLEAIGKPQGLEHFEAGYNGGSTEASADIDDAGRSLQVWVLLGDGSWLAATLDREVVGALSTGRLFTALAVLAIGASALAFWASRKATRPLARFAAAAERLGTDIHAPPLDDTGPSEIRRAALALNRMQERIGRLVEDRSVMLAAISHDLRTVLTRLALRVEAIDDVVQRQKGLADVAGMEAMLSASITLARDAVSVEPLVPLDLAVLLRSLCDDQIDLGHAASYDGPSHLRFVGRPVMLRRVFANLLQNAVVYGNEAAVHLIVAPSAVEVSIADRGKGIPPELREQVFAPFFRVEESRNRESGGAGLGLAIARSGARQHGGDVLLEDRPGGGLCARVSLPL